MTHNKELPFSLNELEELREKFDTPYYIYDNFQIRSNSIKYMNTFRKYFPDFKQFYAVKACPNPSILKALFECGMDFDCSSPEEISVVKMACPSGKIIYSSNYTSQKDLKIAVQNDCIINLDDIDCFDNLIKCGKIPQMLSFRYNPILKADVDVKSNSFSGTDTKFGMTREYILRAYLNAKEYGINRFGLHTMCASNQLDITYWDKIIDSVFELYNELNKLGIELEFINIGGGLGIPYKPCDREIDLEKFCFQLKLKFDENLQKYNLTEPVLYTECGRYITGPYGYLVSTCESIKNNEEIFYGLDANMSNLMRPGMYNSYHHITIPRLIPQAEKIKANVVGTLCENNDWFCKQRELPKGIEKGDLFVIHDCGAHGFSMGFNYNSKLRSCELLKTSKGIELIRDRETFFSLFGNTKIYKENFNFNVYDYVFILVCILGILLYLFEFNIKLNKI
jgi:diaminopimelate decarboxylase